MDWAGIAIVVSGVLIAVIGACVPFIASALVKWLKAKATKDQQDMFVRAVDIVYLVVEAISERTPLDSDDKLAVAIKQLSVILHRELTLTEEAIAEQLLKENAKLDKANVLQITHLLSNPFVKQSSK